MIEQSSKKFEYKEEILSSCVATLHSNATHNNNDCMDLFHKHQHHYQRSNAHTQSNNRYATFLQSVVFVYNHNTDNNNNKYRFCVQLNQFSDLQQHELPLIDTANFTTELEEIYKSTASLQHDEGIIKDKKNRFTIPFKRTKNTLDISNNQFTLLKSIRDIQNVHRSFGLLSQEEKEKFDRDDLNNKKPLLKRSTDDILQEKKNEDFRSVKQYLNYKQLSSTGPNQDEEKVNDFVYDEDDYSTNLNWATHENPDGISLVHPSSYQGSCGSCWAFAATGTLEANISRHSAFTTFRSKMAEQSQKLTTDNDNSKETHTSSATINREEIIQQAQTIERESLKKLSVQELIDCDTTNDHGCTGGNPLSASYFIHKYGLTTNEEYPYIGGKNKKCYKKYTRHPIATTTSWGILTPNDEHNMKAAVRYIGPIAVGFDGSHPSFFKLCGWYI